MPAGVLQDGGLYYWDCNGGPWYQFHVNLHVQDTADPTDQLGGLSVDLATGSLGYSDRDPDLHHPGRAGGLLLYLQLPGRGQPRARAPRSGRPTASTATRPSPALTTTWPTRPPGPGWSTPEYLTEFPNNGEWTIVTYTGLVALPAGAWTLQLTSNQGEECYNQGTVCNFPSSTLWLGTSSSPLGQAGSGPGQQSTVDVAYTSSGQPVDFQLDVVTTGTASVPMLQAEPANGQMEGLPASWFTAADAVLPDGWSESSDGLLDVGYNYLSAGDSQVDIVDSDGYSHVWTATGSSYAPPEGEQGALVHNADGTWSLSANDGDIYQFNAAGEVTSMTAPTDDSNPGAPVFNYSSPVTGLPPRLTSVVDAAHRGLTLVYGGDDQCPTLAPVDGVTFDPDAPADMLCQINYGPATLPTGATSGFEAGSTDLYYSNGHLARITEPGSATVGYPTTDFGYTNLTLDGVTESFLNTVRSPIVNDAIATGTITEPPSAPGEPATAHMTVVGYETPVDGSYAMGQVASLTAPTTADTAAAWRRARSTRTPTARPAPSPAPPP